MRAPRRTLWDSPRGATFLALGCLAANLECVFAAWATGESRRAPDMLGGFSLHELFAIGAGFTVLTACALGVNLCRVSSVARRMPSAVAYLTWICFAWALTFWVTLRPGKEVVAGPCLAFSLVVLVWILRPNIRTVWRGALSKVRGENDLVRLPPGVRVRRILRFVFSKRTCDLVFDPALADMQSEWLEAVVAGHAWHARAIRLRGYGVLLQHVVAQLPVSFLRAAYEVWKASNS